MWAFLIALIIIIPLISSYLYMTIGRKAQLLKKFPTGRKLPFIGNLWEFKGPPERIGEAINKAVKEHGRRFVLWMGHNPFVVLLDCESIQKVLSSPKYVEKGVDYKKFRWILGNGLVTSDANIWKEDRKLFNHYFKYQRVDSFMQTFNKYTNILVNILKDIENQPLNLHPILCRATMDFIHESALGQSSSFQREIDPRFPKAINMILNNFRDKMVRPWMSFYIIRTFSGVQKQETYCRKICTDFLTPAITARKLEIDRKESTINWNYSNEEEETNEKDGPFIDALLYTSSDQEIFCHVLTIFSAGFETTASGMNFTLFLLALNPHCQEKVGQEIYRVLGSKHRDINMSDLAELKYLEMCIKEAMRIYPPVPGFIRRPCEDIELGDGLTIPAGCDVTFFLYDLHRDPKVFPDPEIFIPERFLPENCIIRNPYAFIPFSMGHRNCLGMKYAMLQMKVTLAHILKKWVVTTPQKREDIKVIYGMVLEPKPHILLKLSPRLW